MTCHFLDPVHVDSWMSLIDQDLKKMTLNLPFVTELLLLPGCILPYCYLDSSSLKRKWKRLTPKIKLQPSVPDCDRLISISWKGRMPEGSVLTALIGPQVLSLPCRSIQVHQMFRCSRWRRH